MMKLTMLYHEDAEQCLADNACWWYLVLMKVVFSWEALIADLMVPMMIKIQWPFKCMWDFLGKLPADLPKIAVEDLFYHSLRCFFHCSSPFSVPKWNELAQPTGSFFTLKISLKRCQGWLQLVFNFCPENQKEQLKIPPCIPVKGYLDEGPLKRIPNGPPIFPWFIWALLAASKGPGSQKFCLRLISKALGSKLLAQVSHQRWNLSVPPLPAAV